jgi:hypothetical protein
MKGYHIANTTDNKVYDTLLKAKRQCAILGNQCTGINRVYSIKDGEPKRFKGAISFVHNTNKANH